MSTDWQRKVKDTMNVNKCSIIFTILSLITLKTYRQDKVNKVYSLEIEQWGLFDLNYAV